MIKRLYHADYKGKASIEEWHGKGYQVFLDFKVDDVPHVVEATIKSAKDVGADYISVRQDLIYELRKQ